MHRVRASRLLRFPTRRATATRGTPLLARRPLSTTSAPATEPVAPGGNSGGGGGGGRALFWGVSAAALGGGAYYAYTQGWLNDFIPPGITSDKPKPPATTPAGLAPPPPLPSSLSSLPTPKQANPAPVAAAPLSGGSGGGGATEWTPEQMSGKLAQLRAVETGATAAPSAAAPAKPAAPTPPAPTPAPSAPAPAPKPAADAPKAAAAAAAAAPAKKAGDQKEWTEAEMAERLDALREVDEADAIDEMQRELRTAEQQFRARRAALRAQAVDAYLAERRAEITTAVAAIKAQIATARDAALKAAAPAAASDDAKAKELRVKQNQKLVDDALAAAGPAPKPGDAAGALAHSQAQIRALRGVIDSLSGSASGSAPTAASSPQQWDALRASLAALDESAASQYAAVAQHQATVVTQEMASAVQQTMDDSAALLADGLTRAYRSVAMLADEEIRSAVAKEREANEQANAARRESVRQLHARVAAIDRVLASQAQYQSVAKQVYTLASTLTAVRAAVDHSQPLAVHWARLARDARDFQDPLVQTAVQLVPDRVLATGVISLSTLQQSFADVERACRRAAYLPDPHRTDLPALFYAHAMTFLTFRERGTLVPGDDDHARLTRATFHVTRGELGPAVRELQQLQSAPVQQAARRWLNEAQHRLTVTLALDALNAHLDTLSLALTH